MKAAVKRLVAAVLGRTGIVRLTRALLPCAPLVLMFHRVVPDGTELSSPNRPLMVSQSAFREMMRYIADKDLFISLSGLTETVLTGRAAQRNTVAVTFDDGYRDNYQTAFPILRELGIPATIFLATDHLDMPTRRLWWDEAALFFTGNPGGPQAMLETLPSDLSRWFETKAPHSSTNGVEDTAAVSRRIRRDMRNMPHKVRESVVRAMRERNGEGGERMMLTWDEVREMQEGGLMDFAPHTATHPLLTQISLDQAVAEVRKSMRRVYEELGMQSRLFAYPGGDVPAYHERLAKECGIHAAFTTAYGRVKPDTNPLLLPRVDARYLLLGNTFDRRYFQVATTSVCNSVMEAVQHSYRG